jgi:hypothetical protein
MLSTDCEVYIPHVFYEKSQNFREVYTEGEKQYLIEYDRDGTFGQIVEKHKHKGNDLLVIDYFHAPFSKTEIENEELHRQQLPRFNFIGYINPCSNNTECTSIYKDVPRMTMCEIQQKRQYFLNMRTIYLNNTVGYYPHIYTTKQENCEELVAVDDAKYFIDLTTGNVVQLHKFDHDEMIVIDYFTKPLLKDHIFEFTRNDCYLLSWPFSINTQNTVKKCTGELTATFTLEQICKKQIEIKKITQSLRQELD